MRLLPMSLATLIVVSSISIPMPVFANQEQLVANICNYVVSDDRNRLRKKLKENRVKLRNIYDGVSCDGDSLLRTAMKNSSKSVGTFIAKRLSVSDLDQAESDGLTITAWAENHGYSDSDITVAIKTRLAGS